MGASGWDYAVAYQEDVAAALSALQREVFASGDYYAGWDAAEDEKPATIADLLDQVEDEGTHSVIDMMEGVSDRPALFTVSPLTEEQLVEFFASTRPDAEQVQQWMDDANYSDVRERWSGVYVVSWAGDAPDKVHFGGFSGD